MAWANIGNINNLYGPANIAIGYLTGNNQGTQSVAVGDSAGSESQGQYSVAVGPYAGQDYQHDFAVAIGYSAAYDQQGNNAIAIGNYAGGETQGNNAIAIGYYAAYSNQPANSIVLNGSGDTYATAPTNSGFYVHPVRNDTSNTANAVYFNSTTNELTYGPAGSGSVYANTVASFGTDFGIGPNYNANDPAILFSADDMVIRTGGTATSGGTNNGQMDIAASEVLNIGLATDLVDAVNITTYSSYIQFPYGGNTVNVIAGNNYLTVDATTGLTYNGNPISATANTGNVTFNDVNIIGTGNLYLQPNPANADAYLDIYLSSGPDVHIAGNGETVIVGRNTTANVAVNNDGNVTIQAWNGSASTWTFDYTGNLTAPNQINANAITLKNTDAFDQIVFSSDGGSTNNGYIKVDGGTNMVINSAANFSVKRAGQDRISVTDTTSDFMAATNVRIQSNKTDTGNTRIWTFDTTGNLNLPSNTANINYANGVSILDGIGGGGGNYGNSNVATFLADFGSNNISTTGSVTANTYYTNGNLYIGDIGIAPGSAIVNAGNVLAIYGQGANASATVGWVTNAFSPGNIATIDFNSYADGNILVLTGSSLSPNTWAFDPTGNLTIPGDLLFANSAGQIYGNDTIAIGNGTGDNQVYVSNTMIGLQTYNGNIYNTWQFDTTGNLTLPGNTFAVNYANGTPVTLGGGGNTGNFVFDSYSLDSTTFDEITVGEGSSGNILINAPSLAMFLSGGDSAGMVAGNGNVYVFNNDPTFVDGIPQPGVGYTWQFDNNGNLNTPQGGWIGAATGKGLGTMLTGGRGNLASLTSYYADTDFYSSCVTVNADGTLNITTYGNGTGQLGQWNFADTTLNVPGNGTITTTQATGGLGGNSITITAGAADQGSYSTNPGGNLTLQGGLGAFNDGGGGGPGGSVNITSGNSADPAGHSGNVTINTSSNTWNFTYSGGLNLATVNSESAQFVGARKVIGGLNLTSSYAVTLSAGGTPTVAYTSLAGSNSVKVTFAIQSGGGTFQWEQFDVVAVPSQDVAGTVNFVVSNRIKAAAGVADTEVTATMSGSQIVISLNMAAGQTSGEASYDAVEFGLMVD